MVSTELTGMLRQLNARGVSRLEPLEVLLLLSRHSTTNWDAERVAGSSAIPRAVAVDALAHLCSRELRGEPARPRARRSLATDSTRVPAVREHLLFVRAQHLRVAPSRG